MPLKCCVPLCSSNYETKEKNKVVKTKEYVPMYRFPKDKEEQTLWKRQIPRVDLVVTKHSAVCRNHWPQNADFKKVPGGRFRPINPPTIFPNVPRSCLRQESLIKERPTTKSLSEVRSLQEDELNEFEQIDAIAYSTLLEKIQIRYKTLLS